MRKSAYMLTLVVLALLVLLLSPGCGPEDVTAKIPTKSGLDTGNPITPPPSTLPAPTITLKASPTAIERGESTTLTWNSSNATGVIIDNNVGTVEPSGSRTISPYASTTYRATATGDGGNAVAEARVTVELGPPITKIDTLENREIKEEDGTIVVPRDVRDAFFNYDQYVIRVDDLEALKNNVVLLKKYPSIQIRIDGYCDERGSDKYNLALGDRRANAVKDYLVNQGIDGSRIETMSYGKEKFFCEESNEECWQLNRRAHFVIR